MKRSEINAQIREARQFFKRLQFHLPPFADWTVEQWQTRGHEADEIRDCALGWDVTDFGSGDFRKTGLLCFTLRNGRLGDAAYPKAYAEKIMVVREGQITPFHFHAKKREDIINRGAGRLVVTLFNSDADESFARTPVRVTCDGVVREVPAGGQVVLDAGESITLVPRLYHTFHAEVGAGMALIGEVSSVNDDSTDNRFNPPLPRYPAIDADEAAEYLLCNEYPAAQ